MDELVKEFRGIPLEAARKNIRRLEAIQEDDTNFRGPDYSITLEELTPVQLGSMTLDRLRFVLRAEPSTIEQVWDQLAPGFLRGGD